MSNVNEETGIRFGIISANSLNQDVFMDIVYSGRDVHWDEFVDEVKKETRAKWEAGELANCEDETDLEDIIEDLITNQADNFYDDEPVIEFTAGGVSGRTTWLGGEQMLWVFESPHTTKRSLCSPCVPGAVDLDSGEYEEGYEGYDVPPGWRDTRNT